MCSLYAIPEQLGNLQVGAQTMKIRRNRRVSFHPFSCSEYRRLRTTRSMFKSRETGFRTSIKSLGSSGGGGSKSRPASRPSWVSAAPPQSSGILLHRHLKAYIHNQDQKRRATIVIFIRSVLDVIWFLCLFRRKLSKPLMFQTRAKVPAGSRNGPVSCVGRGRQHYPIH